MTNLPNLNNVFLALVIKTVLGHGAIDIKTVDVDNLAQCQQRQREVKARRKAGKDVIAYCAWVAE